jgi:hypothetical protein
MTVVYEYDIFFTVRQRMCLCDVELIESRSRDRMSHASLYVCPNVRIYIKVPLVTLIRLVHLWVTLTRVGLYWDGGCNQRGVNDRACFKQQATLDQLGIQSSKHLRSQVDDLKQITESENGALIRQVRGAWIEINEFLNKSMVFS